MDTKSIPSVKELHACTEDQLTEAALVLRITIQAACIYEPQNPMAKEKKLLSNINCVLGERALSEHH